MISLEELHKAVETDGEYQCRVNLNLYDSPSCTSLATQASAGRHLQILSRTLVDNAFEVRLAEDGYSGWLSAQDITELEYTPNIYQAIGEACPKDIAVSTTEIQNRIPQVVDFTLAAMKQPNYYLWGGTVAPNYDCSGLMQAAFAASGIWLPRDSYQQAAFTQSISVEELLVGDLIFFGTQVKVNHVGLYIGDGCYIHSSGKEIGRNGIGIDKLGDEGDEIGRSYYRRLLSCGRVVESYRP
jgi:cell wall-associated NlpC family hydrolase